MYTVLHYTNDLDEDEFAPWLESLPTLPDQAIISARLIRLKNGNFGDCKPISDGVWELRFKWGPGYRVYYAKARGRVVLLCAGGDKGSQKVDIKQAIKRWKNWQTRSKK
jgi:putative addiction module killer protein